MGRCGEIWGDMGEIYKLLLDEEADDARELLVPHLHARDLDVVGDVLERELQALELEGELLELRRRLLRLRPRLACAADVGEI